MDGSLLLTLEGHTLRVSSVAWSDDGTMLASGSWDKSVRVWRGDDGRLQQTLQGHSGPVTSVAWSQDGTMLASGSDDQTVRVWRVMDGSLVRTLLGHTYRVTSVGWNRDGTLLASGSWDNSASVASAGRSRAAHPEGTFRAGEQHWMEKGWDGVGKWIR
jgi:WD40 repeat protein